jgi:hypothetical protein
VRVGVLGQMERIPSNRGILGEWVRYGTRQEAIEEFHNRLVKKQKKHGMWWGHHLSFSGVGDYTNVSHQVASEIKAKDFQWVLLK